MVGCWPELTIISYQLVINYPWLVDDGWPGLLSRSKRTPWHRARHVTLDFQGRAGPWSWAPERHGSPAGGKATVYSWFTYKKM